MAAKKNIKIATKRARERKTATHDAKTSFFSRAAMGALALAVLSVMIWVAFADTSSSSEDEPEDQRLDALSADDLHVAAPPDRFSITTPKAMRVKVHRELRHDRRAFTQGLEVHNGAVYESTGQYGESSFRRIDLKTGIVQQARLPDDLFAEGLTRVGREWFQLTWRSGIAIVYDDKLKEKRRLRYTGEGWGLCYNGRDLVMSNGSAMLFVRDAETFKLKIQLAVKKAGKPAKYLNELECVGTKIYANVWQSDEILRIDAKTGTVEAVIDASMLLSERDTRKSDVLNGIAHLRDGRFLITGKYWPKMFEVSFEQISDSQEKRDS